MHHLVIVAYVNVIVKADERVRLLVYSLDGLLRLYHQREHLGVLVCVVWLEVAIAYLPDAEQFGSVVGQCSEAV